MTTFLLSVFFLFFFTRSIFQATTILSVVLSVKPAKSAIADERFLYEGVPPSGAGSLKLICRSVYRRPLSDIFLDLACIGIAYMRSRVHARACIHQLQRYIT